MTRRWLAVAVVAWGIPMPASARRVEVAATADRLTEAVLSEDTSQWTVCPGEGCPTAIGALRVGAPAIGLVGTSIQVRGQVHVELAVVGIVDADVMCTVVPVLLDTARVTARGGECRIERITSRIPSFLQGGVIATLEPALGAILAAQLAAADPWDLLASAREGLLAGYAADPALQAPAAAGSVRAIRSVGVREGKPATLVVGIDVD